AAASPYRPEQVGVLLRIGAHDAAVGRHHLGGEDVVDGQPVLADQEADPSGEGDPADSHRCGVTETRGEPVPSGSLGVITGERSGLGPRGPAVDVDLHPVHVPQVDDDAAFGGAVPGQAVATAAHRHFEALLGGESHGTGDVFGVGYSHHRGRSPVEVAVQDLPVGVVGFVVGAYDPPLDRIPEAV